MESVENLAQILDSLLFTSNRPLKAKDLAKILEVDEAQVAATLNAMVESKKNNGIVLLQSREGYQLATNSANSTHVKNFLNAELREKLTDATVEVLAIIAYRQPISKAEIESIRGVNSQYSIRSLLMRGMIEKVANPNDARSVCYQTTTEFLMHMGLTSNKDLPEFEKLVEQIKLPETPGLTIQANSEPTGQESSVSQPPVADEPKATPEIETIELKFENSEPETAPEPASTGGEPKKDIEDDEEEDFDDEDEDDEE